MSQMQEKFNKSSKYSVNVAVGYVIGLLMHSCESK